SHQPPSQTIPSTSGSPTATTTRREVRPDTGSAAAEAPPPLRVGGERLAKLGGAEVGPEGVDEDELRVRHLPEEEVRDSELAGRADQQVRVGEPRGVELRRESVLVHLAWVHPRLDEAARGLDELVAAAVVEGDPEVEALVVVRLVLERL